METLLTWLPPALTWLAAAILGGVIGAYINGLVARRMKALGRIQFLRTRIVADKPKDVSALSHNRYVLELRMHNTSDEPKVVESPVITFNMHKRGTSRRSPVRLESPMTKLESNDPDVGMNIPFRLKNTDGKPLEYVVVPPGELKVLPVEIDTQSFDFRGVPEPRRNANKDLESAFQASHVLIHFRYPSDKCRHSQVIVDTSGWQGWEYQHVVYFPPAVAT